MISKSLSRKSPSFNQLAEYMKESGYGDGAKSDARYEIYNHCFSRDRAHLAAEFFANSQLLAKRKNGNYLYHEILSITVEAGVDRDFAKRSLRELAGRYIDERAPRNMVYGCLHDDHADHIHYHLMISANEKGEAKRTRLSRARFDEIKKEIEAQCLADFPQLKQRPIMGASRAEKKLSRKAAEVKRQGKKLDRQDHARKLIVGAMVHSETKAEFLSKLEAQGAQFYTRGKNYGIELHHPDGKVEKYRFATLGIHEDYKSFLATTAALEAAVAPEMEADVGNTQEPREAKSEDSEFEGEKEKEPEVERSEKSSAEEVGRDAKSKTDNDCYVKYDSNTDLKGESSQQQTEPEDQEDAFRQEMLQRRAKQVETKQQSRGPKGRNR